MKRSEISYWFGRGMAMALALKLGLWDRSRKIQEEFLRATGQWRD